MSEVAMRDAATKSHDVVERQDDAGTDCQGAETRARREADGLDPAAYGTHSLPRTKPTLTYRRTKNLRALQLLLGHTKLENTVTYLAIEVDDAVEIAEQTEV